MFRTIPKSVWLLIAAGLVCLTGLNATHLWDVDEALYSSCAREMHARGDWITPTFNGELFADKPPLAYWMMMGSFHLWGVNAFAARFPAALCALACAWATYRLGKHLFCERAGFWAGLIVSTTLIFAISARAATLDSALTLFTTLAFLVFAREKKNWSDWVLIYLLLGLAVLTKGPIGAVLPIGVMGLFLLVSRRFSFRNLWEAIRTLRPVTGILVMGAVAIPWYWLVNARTEGEFLRRFLGEQNFSRAMHPMDGHSGPIFYYLIAILVGFFPWSVFLVSALFQLGRRLSGHPWQQGYRLILCWIGVFVVFWSLVSTKLPHYVLPAYPAFALAVGAFMDAWLSKPGVVGRIAAIVLIVVGIGIMVALPIVAHHVLPGEGLLGLVGLVLCVGGGMMLWNLRHDRTGQALQSMAVTAVVFLVAVFAVAARWVDRHQETPQLLAAIRQSTGELPPLCTYRFQRPSLIFYAEKCVPQYRDDQALAEALLARAKNPPWVITSDEFEKELLERFPGQLTVAVRCPKLAKPRGEIIVLSPK